MRNVKLLCCTALCALTCGSPAIAQGSANGSDAASAGVETVVVSANRREQNQQDVGTSVTAYSVQQLQDLGVTSSTDIARITPGVFASSSFGGEDQQYSVRGVTQNDFGDTAEGPVAVYVDDGYVPTLQGQGFGLFDISRVEILKGPQGTLFGRNATGGLAQYIINKPTEDLSGYANVSYGAYNDTKIEAAISDTIFGKLTGRASFFYNNHDPIYTNVYPAGIPSAILSSFGPPPSPCCANQNSDHTIGGRLQLQLEATDKLTIRATASYLEQDLSTNGSYSSINTIAEVNAAGVVTNSYDVSPTETRASIGPGGVNYTALPNSPLGRLPGASWFGFTPPSIQNLQVSSDFALPRGNLVRAGDGSLHIDYDFGSVQFSAITDFTQLQKNFGLDLEQSPVNFGDFGDRAQTSSVSQELRLSGNTESLTWTAGIYYLDITTHSVTGLLAPKNSLYADSFGVGAVGVDLLDDVHQNKETYSVFGQLEYRFAPRWNLVLGLRGLQEHQKFNFVSNAYRNDNDYQAGTALALFQTLPSYSNSHLESLWAGRAQIEFRPEDNLLLYAGINRGVKGGGYNVQLPDGSPVLPPSQIPFKPETLVAYETGVKSTLLDQRLVLNGDIFYYDYSNYQAFTFQNLDGLVQNRNGKTYGGEVSLEAVIAEGLKFASNFAVTDAQVENVQVSPGLFRNAFSAYAPKYQVNGRLRYTIPDAVYTGHVTLMTDANYQSAFYDNIRNFTSEKLSGYGLFDARIAWENDPGDWELSAGVQNIADKRYETGGYDISTTCGCSEISYGNPRWWSIAANYKF